MARVWAGIFGRVSAAIQDLKMVEGNPCAVFLKTAHEFLNLFQSRIRVLSHGAPDCFYSFSPAANVVQGPDFMSLRIGFK
jgi:hypothetical protein